MNRPNQSPIQPAPWRELLGSVRGAWPPSRWRNVGVVVGCSGGADSVALLRALCELRQIDGQPAGFVIAAHFDHGIRGSEADQDADFVRRLSEKLGIPHASDHAVDLARDESTMRAARLAFLRQTAQSAGARYVALAQSADDNVETVLHHLMRGTGPRGLAGMPMTRSLGEDPIGQDLVLIRPLLAVRRKQIRDALKSICQNWREDSSNEDVSYQRNWIRRELLPFMETRFPAVIEAVERAVRLQGEWTSTIEAIADHWIQQHVSPGPPVRIQRDDATPTAIVVTALQQIWASLDWPLGEMAHDHWRRLAKSVASDENERYSLPGGIDVRCHRRNVEVTQDRRG